MVTWTVLAVMFLNNLNGVHLIANILLLAGVTAVVAINESTDVYLINQQGILNLKTSKRIDLDAISEIEESPSALAIHTRQNREELLIEGSKLKSKSLSQVAEAIERLRENRNCSSK